MSVLKRILGFFEALFRPGTIKVVSVKSSSDEVIIKFSDGHRAQFEGYYHGIGYGLEGIRSFVLHKAGQRVFAYNTRLFRTGPQPEEHKVAFIAPEYTQQDAARYWRFASEYLNKKYLKNPNPPQELWFPWRLVSSEGGFDLKKLEEGTAELLEEGKRIESPRDHSSDMALFGALASAFGGGGNTGSVFPKSDAGDFQNGAQYIPGEVTLARRRGEKVVFVQEGSDRSKWYWEMPNGSKINHG